MSAKKNSLPNERLFVKVNPGYRFMIKRMPETNAQTPAMTPARAKFTPKSINPARIK
jgi:hypothetical protein